MTDTHCHLDFAAFNKDRDEVINRTLSRINAMVNIGAGLYASEQSVGLANQNERVWATVGLHPQDTEPEVDLDLNKQVDRLKELAESNPRVVAVGETGLDYSPAPPGEKDRTRQEQKRLFISQIKLAQQLDLPLVVHSRDSSDDVLEVLRTNRVERAVLHCFSYTKEVAQQVLDLGLFISFTGIITFKNARRLHDTVKYVPLKKMMLETDAPFLAPDPLRGQRCEPWMVEYVGGKVAELKGVSVEEVEIVTDGNAREFFGLPSTYV